MTPLVRQMMPLDSTKIMLDIMYTICHREKAHSGHWWSCKKQQIRKNKEEQLHSWRILHVIQQGIDEKGTRTEIKADSRRKS